MRIESQTSAAVSLWIVDQAILKCAVGNLRHTETAQHQNCAVLERAIPECAKLDLHHSGLAILACAIVIWAIVEWHLTDCHGISIRSLNVVDLSLTKAKSLIADSLYWLLRWVIAKPEKEDNDDFSSPECSNSSDEGRILMLAQDVEHCATHARASISKHVALGIAIRHMTMSKQLITMLSRNGHCSSYADVEAMYTSIANEIIAKSDIFGVV